MNTNLWLEQKLNEEHQRHMRTVAERERSAQLCRNHEQVARPHRRLLTKLWAEMSELASRWEKTETVSTRNFQRQP